MRASTRAANWVLRRVFQTVCRIDLAELAKVPQSGPLILVGNHVNFLEPPVLMPHLEPRPVIGLAKRGSWDNPLFHFLFDQWEAIPIERGEVNREGFRQALDALAQGKILAVFPEGTRSGDGRMQQAKAGIALLAQRSRAPILPIAFYGYEDFWARLKSLRRTDFHIKVGEPFQMNGPGTLDRDTRQAATDEIMYKVAELLPERYRGYYSAVQTVGYRFVQPV